MCVSIVDGFGSLKFIQYRLLTEVLQHVRYLKKQGLKIHLFLKHRFSLALEILSDFRFFHILPKAS